MSLVSLFRKELTLNETINKSKELADLVKQTYSPDLIVGIATGGILPAYEISKALNIDYDQLTIKRNIDLSKIYESTPKFLKSFITLYHMPLFMITNP